MNRGVSLVIRDRGGRGDRIERAGGGRFEPRRQRLDPAADAIPERVIEP
ncbi:hypothetical protein [Natrinema sp. 74]